MNPLRVALSPRLLASVLVVGLAPVSAHADGAEHGTRVTWDRIEGILVPEDIVGRPSDGISCNPVLDCAVGTPAPWTTTAGSAEVNLDLGRVKFSVRGLVLGGDPSFTNLGTPGLITMVKGTLVCNDSGDGPSELVDTVAVPLSTRGNATFRGDVWLPPSCTDEPADMLFVIRVAEGEPPFLIDRWNAFGAVRTVRKSVPE
jgi:hypothetical protein